MPAAPAFDEPVPLGAPVPASTPHAISVSLPTWADNVAYEEGDPRVVDVQVSGYPRFFIHLSIRKLAKLCEHKFGVPGEQAMLFPTRKIAEACRAFMVSQATDAHPDLASHLRLVQFPISPDTADPSAPAGGIELYIVFFPADAFSLAKLFWQHTGLGISSRLAERCLSLLPSSSDAAATPATTPSAASPVYSKRTGANRHYAAKPSLSNSATPQPSTPSPPSLPSDDLSTDQTAYLEERYNRTLPLHPASFSFAKRALRRRIAGVLVRDTPRDWGAAGAREAELGPSTRGVREVGEGDVWLYPTGMAAIWSAHQAALGVRPPGKSVCFGFPYTDTLKILQKWGPGCHFLPSGLDADIDALEGILSSHTDPSTPPILALFTEFPSNPLLRAADLPRLRALADTHDFLIVVDDSIGNFVNVEVLPYADIVVSSLTKVFSGDSNVMGGSLVLNPRGRHYAALKAHLAHTYEDAYFGEDAIFMERNSRDFRARVRRIDANTAAVCAVLRAQPPELVREVFYPMWTTRGHYDTCRARGGRNTRDAEGRGEEDGEEGGYGGLFSLVFASAPAAHAFFDALPFYKGPSLGTNFTLACPYAVLAHYGELAWAQACGVDPGIVRVSVGMEERGVLLGGFDRAVRAARRAVGLPEEEAVGLPEEEAAA
ncbi:hypothetical protein EIP86_007557 [Pleurotus ostreatoroseus]|nr:hypothetical protein EIP86_007557 [Pleurotus ostreatoroseus]